MVDPGELSVLEPGKGSSPTATLCGSETQAAGPPHQAASIKTTVQVWVLWLKYLFPEARKGEKTQ